MKALAATLLSCTCVSVAAAADSSNQTHPQFYAVWQISHPTAQLRTDSGAQPPLLPDALSAYKKTSAQQAKGDHSWDPVYECQMHGLPRLMYENMPFQILQTRHQVLFMFQWNREFRMIDLDIPHADPPGPQFQGQSVGHWEGDTLVIDSNAFDPSTFLDAAGMPHSDQLHVIERYRVSRDGHTLSGQFTIEDPKTFSQPWTTTATFRKVANGRIAEDTCVERLDLPQYK